MTATAEAATAVAGGDYTVTTAAVTFAPGDFTAGEARKALTVTIADDAVHEAEETFEWKLSAAASAPVAFETSTAVVTVLDDDPEPEWAVSIEPAEVVEGGSAVVSVVSSNGSVFAEEQTVTLTFGGTAVAGDYAAGSTSVTLGAEAGTSGTMTLTTVDDSDEEPDKTVEVVAHIGGEEIARRSLLLRDNEMPNRLAEGAPVVTGLAQVGRLLEADTSGITDADGLGNVVYEYQWVRRDGTEEVDIAGATDASYRPVGVDAGRMLRVRVSFTDGEENAETATSAATEAVAGLPVVGIAAGASPVTEGADAHAVFGLTRTGPTSELLTVAVTVGQTGEFITAPGPVTVTFGVGEGSASLSVAIADDAMKEFAGGSVTAAVEPGTATTYEAGEDARAEVRVLDDDAIVRVSWATASVNVGEGDGTVELGAVAETAAGAGAPGAFVVAATAEAGTAVAGEDYTVTTAAVTFEPGDFTAGDEGQRVARKALTVTIVDDTVNEAAAESFEWVLSAGAGEATGFDGDGARLAVAAVTIEDDDAAPAWAVAVEPNRIEEGESATVKCGEHDGVGVCGRAGGDVAVWRERDRGERLHGGEQESDDCGGSGGERECDAEEHRRRGGRAGRDGGGDRGVGRGSDRAAELGVGGQRRGAERGGDGSADDLGSCACGADAYGGHVGDRGRGRAGERGIRVPVDTERRGGGRRDSGGDGSVL